MSISDGVLANATNFNAAFASKTSANTLSEEQTLEKSIVLKEISTPSNPSAGYLKVYAKNDGNVYKKTSAGQESLLGGGGGGGGSLQWVEAALAPVSSLQSNFLCYEFEDANDHYLYTAIRVPSGYTAGQQIKLRITAFAGGSSNTFLMQTLSTLIRTGTDAISSTTNQRTSTNTAITQSGATTNIPQSIVFDLSSSTGEINSVAVSGGDLILVRLTRDYANDTATDTVYVPVYGAEVTFNG